MIFTLRNIRSLFLSSLHILYENREAEAIARFYFEMKWGIPAHEFAIHPDKIFQNEEWEEMQNDLRRLQNSEPVQYVVGKSEFYGLTLQVNPLVLIPRPETEELVQLLLQHFSVHTVSSNCKDTVGLHDSSFNSKDNVGHHATPPLRILDFCTGSGAIAIAISKQLPNSEVFATDYSEDILKLAQKNAEDNHTQIRTRLSRRLFSPGIFSGILPLSPGNYPLPALYHHERKPYYKACLRQVCLLLFPVAFYP